MQKFWSWMLQAVRSSSFCTFYYNISAKFSVHPFLRFGAKAGVWNVKKIQSVYRDILFYCLEEKGGARFAQTAWLHFFRLLWFFFTFLKERFKRLRYAECMRNKIETWSKRWGRWGVERKYRKKTNPNVIHVYVRREGRIWIRI